MDEKLRDETTVKKVVKRKKTRKKKTVMVDFAKLSLMELVAGRAIMTEHLNLGFGRMTSEGKRVHTLRLAELERELNTRLYGIDISKQNNVKTIWGVRPESAIDMFNDAKENKRFVVHKNPEKKGGE